MAAEYCNVTAGTLSSQVTRLEEYLGVQIFISRAYPARLNPEAEELFALVEDMVATLGAIKQRALALRSSNDRV